MIQGSDSLTRTEGKNAMKETINRENRRIQIDSLKNLVSLNFVWFVSWVNLSVMILAFIRFANQSILRYKMLPMHSQIYKLLAGEDITTE